MPTFDTPGSVSLQIRLPSGRVVVTTADEPTTTVEIIPLGRRGQDAIDEIEVTVDERAGRHVVRIEQYPANRIKQSVTGHGHASKEQMQRAIQHQWSLAKPPDPPDVADALAVALCCGRSLDTVGGHRGHRGHGDTLS